MSLAARWLSGSNNPSKQASVDWGNAVLASINVGLFTEASSATVPTDITTVRTTGYSSEGVGAAEYIYDASVNSTTVASNPRTQFVTANGRGFKLSVHQVIKPTMFGTGLSGTRTSDTNFTVTNQYTALQAFFTWFDAQAENMTADFSGYWGTDTGIVINPTVNRPKTYICGAIVATTGSTGDKVVHLQDVRRSIFKGEFIGKGTGGTAYSGRGWNYGIYLGDVADAHFDILSGISVKRYGVAADGNGASGTQINTSVREIFAKDCGSGARLYDPGGSPEKTPLAFTAVTNSGSASAPAQRSTLTVASVPSELVSGDLLYIHSRFCVYIDSPSSTEIRVWPWVTADVTGSTTNGSAVVTSIASTEGLRAGMPITGSGIPASTTILSVDSLTQITLSANATATAAGVALACGYTGEIRFCHGGAFTAFGGSNTSMDVGTIDGTRVGTCFQSMGLYGVRVRNLQSQQAPVCMQWGSGPGNNHLGPGIFGVHSEATDIDLVHATTLGTRGFICAPSAWGDNAKALERTRVLSGRLATGINSATGALIGATIVLSGETYQGNISYRASNSAATETLSNRPGSRQRTITKRDTVTIKLTWDNQVAQIMGDHHWIEVCISGTGASFQPTGTITIEPDADGITAGYTVNGVSGAGALAISGLAGPVRIRAEMDTSVSPYNWRVYKFVGV